MDSLSDIDKLKFYRDEIKHEFNLIAMRSTILVTCQSFLVVPYAILHTVADFKAALGSILLVATLGVFVAAILVSPIEAGHRTLNKWLIKQRKLFKGTSMLKDLAIDRDMTPEFRENLDDDLDHTRSLAFSRYGPWAFIAFWILALINSFIRFRWMT